MINHKDIYSGRVMAGNTFTVTATKGSVFVTDFITVSLDGDGRDMKALTDDKRIFSITALDICTE